jgi:HAD superfamily hydrolase (TIGR01509 family)
MAKELIVTAQPCFEAVFFDLDGTLANTLPLMQKLYNEFLGSFGHKGNIREFAQCNGKTLAEIVDLLKKRYELSETSAALLEKYQKLLLKRYADSAEPFTGALELLHQLREQKLRLGLVTSGSRETVIPFLEKHRMLDFFEHLVCSEDFKTGKPSPDPYLVALKKFNLSASKALVIEDSDGGVKSAQAADLKALQLVPGKIELSAVWGAVFKNCPPWSLSEKIDQLWNQELKKRPHLHNDSLFAYLEHDETRALGKFVEYKSYLAQRLAPELKKELKITPLAVSGLLIINNMIIFGQRSKTVTAYPGFLELVPSGGISQKFLKQDGTIDFPGQLLAELEEELGFTTDQASLSTFGVVYDENDDCYDIGVEIKLEMNLQELMSSFEKNQEYENLIPISLSQLKNFMLEQKEKLVPTSTALLKARGLI